MNTREFVSYVQSRNFSYNPEAKETFHEEGRKVLKRIAQRMGLPKGSYDIRSNMGGIAVSGEVTLHGEHIYIQLDKGSISDRLLYRRCNGRKDYCGHANHWMRWDELANVTEAVKEFKRVSVEG